MNIEENIDLLMQYITETRRETLLKALQYRTRYVSIILENLYQPHNASAVLRSCDAYGIQDVHVIEQTNSFNPNQEISMGSAKWLTIEDSSSKIEDVYNTLRSQGRKIVATSLKAQPNSLDNFDISQPSAIVFGNELNGLSDQAIELADETMAIPMFGFVESFNISVSVAIILSNIIPRIHKSNVNWKLDEEESKKILLKWLRSDIHKSEEIEARAKQ